MKRSLVFPLIVWLIVGWTPHGVCALSALFSQIAPPKPYGTASCPHCRVIPETGSQEAASTPGPNSPSCPSFPEKSNGASPCCEPFPGSGGVVAQDQFFHGPAAQFWAVNDFEGLSSLGLGWSSPEHRSWLTTWPSSPGKPLFLRFCVLLI